MRSSYNELPILRRLVHDPREELVLLVRVKGFVVRLLVVRLVEPRVLRVGPRRDRNLEPGIVLHRMPRLVVHRFRERPVNVPLIPARPPAREPSLDVVNSTRHPRRRSIRCVAFRVRCGVRRHFWSTRRRRWRCRSSRLGGRCNLDLLQQSRDVRAQPHGLKSDKKNERRGNHYCYAFQRRAVVLHPRSGCWRPCWGSRRRRGPAHRW